MVTNETDMTELSLDWDDLFEEKPSDAESVKSIPDALVLSLSNRGCVDMKYILDVTGEELQAVKTALKGAIYQNPDKWNGDVLLGWETAEEYLSGNMRMKLRSARAANKSYPGRFNENIIAIKKLIVDAVDGKDIYVNLGSPWLPTDVVDSFINHLFKVRGRSVPGTVHDAYTGAWEIRSKNAYTVRYHVSSNVVYGTSRMPALDILERTLNMKTVSVMDEVPSLFTKTMKKRVLNQTETNLALEKQQRIIAEFQDWVWSDPERKSRLEMIYDKRYGCVRRRIFDGSFLTFPGMAENVKLFKYQKDAAARIIFSPNTLLAHTVGSGKTYVMIAAGMELRRMGLSKKNLYVVPNNIVLQWRDFFLTAYPEARILCVDAKSFTPAKREKTLKSIIEQDFDAIIMAYSCFDRLPLSYETLMDELNDARAEIAEIEKTKGNKVEALSRRKTHLEKEVEKLSQMVGTDSGSICFDDLGITRLFVDEAHNYKNVPISTSADRVLGISATGSKKCKDMMSKVHFIQKENGGGGVVMATGTPITNSLTDAFVMQMYLQSGELAMLDLHNFDSWIGMFAERVTEFEVDVDTNSYRLATRFSRFHNLPELTALLASIADFHQADAASELPDFDGDTNVLIPRTDEFVKYLDSISKRAENVRRGAVRRTEDNMLKITTDGRKAALDLRLVLKKAKFTPKSKVFKCAETVYDIYCKYKEQGSAQLIFCDTSTPKEEFNVYDEVKRLLISMGVSAKEIAFVHDATTDAQRAELFEKVRDGEIRILVGSTFKLGTGVNVQDKLIAVHHLDTPWRPSDMTQRNGRILRQGNLCDKVYIYRYVTEGSFDAYSWQLLETKQRFISELLSGSLNERSGSDVDGLVLSYAEVKALAVGNPLVKKRIELANELSRVSSLQNKAIESRIRLEHEWTEMPAQIEHQRELVKSCLNDLRNHRANRKSYTPEERRELRQALADAIKSHLDLPDEQRTVMSYQGFDVVLPINMSEDRPFLWLVNEGKYYVELGDSGYGAIVRIDNYLDKFSEHRAKLAENLKLMEDKYESLGEELKKKEEYSDNITKLKEKIRKIDKELGVNV